MKISWKDGPLFAAHKTWTPPKMQRASVLVPGNGSVFVPLNVGKRTHLQHQLGVGHHWFHGNACPWQLSLQKGSDVMLPQCHSNSPSQAAILSFLASCASQCARCREECSESMRWPQIQQLMLDRLRSSHSDAWFLLNK